MGLTQRQLSPRALPLSPRALPLEPPPPTGETAIDDLEIEVVDGAPVEPAPAARRGRGHPVLAALIAVACVVALLRLVPGGLPTPPVAAAGAAPAGRAIVSSPRPRGRPAWPRAEAAVTVDAWQPAMIRFPDGSSIAVYPDRVRAAAGRPVAIFVERFDPGGRPRTGVLDMELIVDSPGREPFKLGFTEHTGQPGTYDTVVRADQLGIGRAELQLIASQTALPDQPGALATATVTVDVVGGVRFAGALTARWLDGRLVIDVPITTRTAGHATVRGELRAGDEVIAELAADAEVGEGDATIALDAGDVVPAGDPRAASLVLVDGTAITGASGAEQWTDFWRGSRAIAAPQEAP